MHAKKTLKHSIFYFFIVLLLILWMVPLLFCLFTAVKSNDAFYHQAVFSIPDKIEWANFTHAAEILQTYMKNGVIICILKVPLGIFVECLAAYAMTRLKLKCPTAIFVFFLVGMMIPHQVALVPLNIALSRLGLTNTYWGLFYVYVGFGIPFGILVLRGFMRAVPTEIDESARIDGANNWKLFTHIIVPITKPAISTLLIMDFLSTWNEFLLASVLITDDSMRTVPAGLLRFQGQAGAHYPTLCAGVLISILPVFIVYLIFQRYFVEGMAGAVKG